MKMRMKGCRVFMRIFLASTIRKNVKADEEEVEDDVVENAKITGRLFLYSFQEISEISFLLAGLSLRQSVSRMIRMYPQDRVHTLSGYQSFLDSPRACNTYMQHTHMYTCTYMDICVDVDVDVQSRIAYAIVGQSSLVQRSFTSRARRGNSSCYAALFRYSDSFLFGDYYFKRFREYEFEILSMPTALQQNE